MVEQKWQVDGREMLYGSVIRCPAPLGVNELNRYLLLYHPT
jgi:hypothetical protein